MLNWNSYAGFLAVAVLLVAVCGCDDGRPKTYPVHGTVVYKDGTTPEFGDIEFYHAELKLNAHGKVQKDGTFVLGTYDVDDGAVAGTHEVIIIQRTRNHLMAGYEGEIKHDHGEMLHTKYYDYRTSKLTATIEPKELNEITLTVDKMPRKEQSKVDH